MTFFDLRPAPTCFVHFPPGDQNRPTETCQIAQTKNDQSRKPVAIAPVHETGNEYRLNGVNNGPDGPETPLPDYPEERTSSG